MHARLRWSPNQIGVNRSVEVSPNTRAQTFTNPDGSQIIVLIVKSAGASGRGVHFRNFALADGEEVNVYGPGPIASFLVRSRRRDPGAAENFGLGTVDGGHGRDRVLQGNLTKTEKDSTIFEISHILADLDWRLRPNEPDVLGCQVDASCYGDREKDAVGRILFNDNGMFVCTGTLVNDLAQDRTPYFLTANHCVPTPRQSLKPWKYIGFIKPQVVTAAFCGAWIHSPPGANLLRGATYK